MKTEMRRRLARQPFEEKIRKVSQLIQLSTAVKASRVREDAPAMKTGLPTRPSIERAADKSKL